MASISDAGREVLARAALDVLGVLFEQALVGVALHVGRHLQPRLVADQIDDELAELGRVLNLVLRLAEDEPEHPALLSELGQSLPVVLSSLRPSICEWRGRPSDSPLGIGLLCARHGRALVGHLQEQQEGQLLEVVLIGEAVVAEDIAVVPEFLDDAVGIARWPQGHHLLSGRRP